jgi:hypothetical protein
MQHKLALAARLSWSKARSPRCGDGQPRQRGLGDACRSALRRGGHEAEMGAAAHQHDVERTRKAKAVALACGT